MAQSEYNVQRSLGRIESKVDAINQRLDSMNGSIKDHATQINNLESFRDNLQGRMTILGTIAGFIGAMITAIINHFIKN
jgi:hypothetical protein